MKSGVRQTMIMMFCLQLILLLKSLSFELMPTPIRQLVAIILTGYTALMGKDSNQALELGRQTKLFQKPLVEYYNGKWLKEMGDDTLASYPTISDALYCAGILLKARNKKLDK